MDWSANGGLDSQGVSEGGGGCAKILGANGPLTDVSHPIHRQTLPKLNMSYRKSLGEKNTPAPTKETLSLTH